LPKVNKRKDNVRLLLSTAIINDIMKVQTLKKFTWSSNEE